MEKAPEAFRTISEVAVDLDVPKHVLRFWEGRFPQLKPMKRGGGRRYYRPEDVELLRGIRHLLYDEGYTIRGVQRILREQGGRNLVQRRRQGDAPAHPLKIDIPDVAADARGSSGSRPEPVNGRADIPDLDALDSESLEAADLEAGGMLDWIVAEIERCREILQDARSEA